MSSRTSRRTRSLTAALVLALLAGCVTGGQGNDTADTTLDRAPRIRVHNDNWANVTVYAVREGLKIRLGTVTTGRSATFELPAMMRHAADVRLRVEPLASSAAYVSPVLVWGQDVTLRVANDLAQSTLMPWRSSG